MLLTPDLSLTFDNISKAYGNRRVLSRLTHTVYGGQCLAIVGANGSGKSTLLKIVAGLLRPSKGTISVQSDARVIEASSERRQMVGYCAPDLALYPELTGAENLRFFSEVRGETMDTQEIESRLATVGLQGRGQDSVSAYSSGMKQRLRLAFAIRGGGVPLLLLDEPSLALDPQGVALVENVILRQKAERGITLLATNDAREVAWADQRLSVEIAA